MFSIKPKGQLELAQLTLLCVCVCGCGCACVCVLLFWWEGGGKGLVVKVFMGLIRISIGGLDRTIWA